MVIDLKDNLKMSIRAYEEGDINNVQFLNEKEGWTNLVQNPLSTKEAWKNSNIAFVVETESKELVGYIRGHTDTRISLFICEMLTDKKYRGLGIGKTLLKYVHNIYPSTRIEMLATSSSRSFYKSQGYREFYGFRKSYKE